MAAICARSSSAEDVSAIHYMLAQFSLHRNHPQSAAPDPLDFVRVETPKTPKQVITLESQATVAATAAILLSQEAADTELDRRAGQ